MPGLTYIVTAVVLTVAHIAMLAAQLFGQLLGLLILLTSKRPKVMIPVLIVTVSGLASAPYWPAAYSFARGEMHAFSTGVRAGRGSDSDLCRTARTTFAKLALFNADVRSQFNEALNQRCWHIPEQDVRRVCPEQTVSPAQLPACIAEAEACYKAAMEFAVGWRGTGMEARDCLDHLRTMDEIKARAAASPRPQPK